MKRLAIFLRAPRVGAVKTRLGQQIGMELARDAYCQLVERLLESLSDLTEVELRISPDDAEKEVARWLKPNWTISKQGGGELTERLQLAFAEAFQRGDKRVVIIGSDCPYLSRSDVHEAWSALTDHDLVLGPATDGGYWLVGLSKPAPEIFEGIPWSSAEVLEKTLALAVAAGLKTRLLRTLSDVDTQADWERFQRTQSGVD